MSMKKMKKRHNKMSLTILKKKMKILILLTMTVMFTNLTNAPARQMTS